MKFIIIQTAILLFAESNFAYLAGFPACNGVKILPNQRDCSDLYKEYRSKLKMKKNPLVSPPKPTRRSIFQKPRLIGSQPQRESAPISPPNDEPNPFDNYRNRVDQMPNKPAGFRNKIGSWMPHRGIRHHASQIIKPSTHFMKPINPPYRHGYS